MFIGHYAVAMALKKAEPSAPLGVLFVGVQAADFLFFPLAMLGVEQATIIPGLTEASPLRLDYAPFSHGLLGLLVLSLIAYLAVRLFPFDSNVNRNRVGLAVGLAVASHWVLDVITHTPDMPLVDGGLPKLGLGLWNSAILTFAVEAAMVLGGLWLYLKAAGGTSKFARNGMIALVAVMLVLNLGNILSARLTAGGMGMDPAETNIVAIGLIGLAIFLIFTVAAYYIDRRRLV